VTETAVASDEAPAKASRSPYADLRVAGAMVLGGLVLLTWIGLLAGSWAGISEEATRLLTDVLLGVTVLAALAALLCSVAAGVVAVIGAAVFAAAWYYIGWSLSYAIEDALYYGLVAGFYLAPIVVGLAAILASRSRANRLSHR